MVQREGEDHVLTLPNAITAVRLACIPVFVVLVLLPHRRAWLAAAIVLAALGATDFVDGFLARRLGQVSTVGKVLDPLTDRLLLVTGAVVVIAVGAVPPVIAVLAVAREVVVAVGFLVVVARHGGRMDVRLEGKAATLCLMVALPLFLVAHSRVGWEETADVLAWVFAVANQVIGWYAVARYVPDARAAIGLRRRDRRTGPGGGGGLGGSGAPRAAQGRTER